MNDKTWLATIAITLVLALGIIIISSKHEFEADAQCKKQRIIPFPEKMFYWTGMMELGQKGEYQPKCL